jgi:IMP dehydrogenase
VQNPAVDEFMQSFPNVALTYDDVTLVTQYADFLPDETSISTRLTSRITLNTPIVSAAMDTVTEADMAIAMALNGGIGVIHKNLSAEEQCRHVRLVKNHLNGLILSPVCFHEEDTIDTILAYRRKHSLRFGGFPILDAQDRLTGILTRSDVHFATSNSVKARDIMTRATITAAPGTSLEEAYRLMIANKVGKLPLVDPDGRLAGLYSFTDVKNLVENKNPLYSRDAHHRLRAAAAVGVTPHDHDRADRLVEAGADVLVVDSAHGHSKGILDMVKWLVAHHPDTDVIAGNVATAEGALAIRDAGAHAVKVGIGPGSICTTRVVCGVGIPQLTAVYQAAKAVDGSIPVIADGGLKLSGDIPKAIVAGADTVMLGSLLAGSEESPGEKIIYEGRQYVVYRGMGSIAAMKDGAGSRERYGQASTASDDLVPQGIEGVVPFAGPVQRILAQFAGGLRAALGYCGCRTIPELQRRGRFWLVTDAGRREAHPHDVRITKEAPNYRS